MPHNGFLFAVHLVGLSLAAGWVQLFGPALLAALALGATKGRTKRTPRAVLYCRISRDRATEVSMAVQERDGRNYAQMKGWEVVEVYRDRGKTASKGAFRPGYERMLQDIEAGAIDVVIIWKLDRLGRSVIQLNSVAERLKEKKCDLVSMNDSIDTSTPGGRFVYTVLAAVAQLESEQIALRVTASAEERARNGHINGGGSRPFGYEDDRVTINKAEKKLLLEAARRVLAGETASAVARDWNARGVPTPASGRGWWPAGIGRILMNDHVAGVRRLPDDTLVTGNWPAIIDPETRSQLQERFADPYNRTRVYTRQLLSGILYCGACGTKMSGGSGVAGTKKFRYRCRVDTLYPGCGKCSVVTGPIDKHIRGLVLVALTDPEFRRAMRSGMQLEDLEALEAEIDDIEERLRALAADFGRRKISQDEWQAARAPLSEELEAKKSELRGAEAAKTPGAPEVPGTIPELEAWWDQASQLDRRALVRGVIERIDVSPAPRSGPFVPSRVKVTRRV